MASWFPFPSVLASTCVDSVSAKEMRLLAHVIQVAEMPTGPYVIHWFTCPICGHRGNYVDRVSFSDSDPAWRRLACFECLSSHMIQHSREEWKPWLIEAALSLE